MLVIQTEEVKRVITEYEWRRQAQRRRRRRTTLWGAQCMVSAKPCCTLMQDRSFQLFLLLLALSFALVLPQLVPYTSQDSFAELPVTGGQTAASPRQVRQITYAFPAELEVEQKIYSADELMRGGDASGGAVNVGGGHPLDNTLGSETQPPDGVFRSGA